MNDRQKALFDAVITWAGDCEGRPGDPSDARLLKALWTYEGDRTEPCPECDGDCGEPCAPCSVVAAHAFLDKFIVDWEARHGVVHIEAESGADTSNRRGRGAAPRSTLQTQ